MKIKWRQHEMSLVAMIAVFALLAALGDMVLGPTSIAERATLYQHLIWLQFIISTIQFGAYVWLNRFVIPKLYPGNSLPTNALIRRYAIAALQIIIIAYLLGPLTNHISFYLTERYPDKTVFNFLNSALPRHPQPFFNSFGGLQSPLIFIAAYLVYAMLRESLIHYLERKEGRRQ